MAKFSIKVKNLEKGLRPSEYNVRDNGFLTTCSGMVGRDEVLQAMDLLPRLDITDTFPYPQIFDFTVMTIICSETDIYEWVDGALVLKLTVAGGLTWRAVDFNDFIYMSNGVVAVTRDPRTKVYSIAAQPITTAICNYNGQVIVTDKYVPPIYFTSRPYPIISEEQAGLESIELTSGVFRTYITHDYTDWPLEETELNSIELTSGVFKTYITRDYTDWPLEETELNSIELTSGVFRTYITRDYTDWPPEETELNSIELTSGVFRVAMINYTYWPLEETELTGVSLTEGVHETA